MSRGVVYLLCGPAAAERLIVSLFTLHKHWMGPVTIGAATPDDEAAIAVPATSLGAQVLRVDKAAGRNAHYASKSLAPAWTPYEETVFLDADTIVTGPIDALFGHRLAITQFAEWVSTGPRMSKRCRDWKGISPYIDTLIERQVQKSHPAINTGVIGFRKSDPQLAMWHAVTMAGKGRFIGDEIAMQLVHPELECTVMDDRWNCSPFFGLHKGEAVVWHFHGRKHLRKDAGRVLWLPAFQEAVAAKAGKLDEWAGKYDKWVRDWLKTNGRLDASRR